jgi:hypothetical protein
VLRPGASHCRPSLLCYACAVARGPAAHDRSASFPCTGRPGTGKTKGKQAGQHTASRSWEELLEVDAVTALKVVASKRRTRRAGLPGESKPAVRVPLLPLLRAELGQTRQGSSRSRAWGQAREPAARRDRDQLEDHYASCCPCGFCVLKKARDRFKRDTVGGCHFSQRFFLLHHTTQHRRPLGSGKSVCRLLWPWLPMLDHHRRRADVRGFIVSEQVLHLEIQFASRSKQEAENW